MAKPIGYFTDHGDGKVHPISGSKAKAFQALPLHLTRVAHSNKKSKNSRFLIFHMKKKDGKYKVDAVSAIPRGTKNQEELATNIAKGMNKNLGGGETIILRNQLVGKIARIFERVSGAVGRAEKFGSTLGRRFREGELQALVRDATSAGTAPDTITKRTIALEQLRKEAPELYRAVSNLPPTTTQAGALVRPGGTTPLGVGDLYGLPQFQAAMGAPSGVVVVQPSVFAVGGGGYGVPAGPRATTPTTMAAAASGAPTTARLVQERTPSGELVTVRQYTRRRPGTMRLAQAQAQQSVGPFATAEAARQAGA